MAFPAAASLVLCLIGSVAGDLSSFTPTLPCLLDPAPRAKAGTNLTFALANLQNSTCETTLSFADTNFPPSHAIAQPRACAAEQLISFAIPQAAPDGLAELQWVCGGLSASACFKLAIYGGSNDLESYLGTLTGEARVLCQTSPALRHNLTAKVTATSSARLHDSTAAAATADNSPSGVVTNASSSSVAASPTASTGSGIHGSLVNSAPRHDSTAFAAASHRAPVLATTTDQPYRLAASVTVGSGWGVSGAMGRSAQMSC